MAGTAAKIIVSERQQKFRIELGELLSLITVFADGRRPTPQDSDMHGQTLKIHPHKNAKSLKNVRLVGRKLRPRCRV